MNVIEESIKKILPTLEEDKMPSLLALLDALGVSEPEDLAYVVEEDFRGILKPIQARKLLITWKNTEFPKVTFNPGIPGPSVVFQTESPSESLTVKQEISESSTSSETESSEMTANPEILGLSISPATEYPQVRVKQEMPEPSTSFETDAPVMTINLEMTGVSSSELGIVKPLEEEWASKFNIPWQKMPVALMEAIQEKQRPKPSLRLTMIRIICWAIMEECNMPTNSDIQKIAKAVVTKYPDSFGDIFCGELLCGGYGSLAKQLKIRCQNLNRGNSFNTLKRKRKKEELCSSTKKLLPSDQYGCINWQPTLLPDLETKQSQLNKKKTMQVLYQKGAYESSEIKTLLQKTYASQRRDINNKLDIDCLISEWPLLFTVKGFLDHFLTLTGVDIVEKIHDALENKGRLIAKYIQVKPVGCCKKSVRNFLDEVMGNKHCLNCSKEFTIFIIMAYFGEKRDSLFITADSTTTVDGVIKKRDFPVTPCVVICGETEYSGTSYVLCVEKKIVCNNIDNFESALCMVFASYYCLNIQYPHTVAATLEFIQRCFLNINPNRGSKVSREFKKRHQIFNGKVLTLLKGIADGS